MKACVREVLIWILIALAAGQAGFLYGEYRAIYHPAVPMIELDEK